MPSSNATHRHDQASGLTQRLSEALAAVTYADLSADVIEAAHRAILDWLGSAIAGAREAPARMAQQFVARLGVSDESTVLGAGRGSAPGAALANGVASHILELDDVHKGSTTHPAAAVIPAALAVAEREHSDGRDFVTAVTVGYEAVFRIGEAIGPSHYRFWHPTGTVGTFGAAAAAAHLMRLPSDRLRDALGSAGTQAAGLWEFNSDGAMSKHLHPGKAAFNGVLGADLARVGFTGAGAIVEGERGFLRAMSSAADPSRITDGLGVDWKIPETCFKLHASCGHTHSAIDLALALRSERAWSARDVLGRVAAVRVLTYAPGYAIVKENNPRTPYQAQFSLAYCVAAALLEGRVGLEQFTADRFSTHGVQEEAIAALLPRVQVAVDDELTTRYPAKWPARLEVSLTDGTVVTSERDYPRGNPEDAVSTSDLEAKFRRLALRGMHADAVERTLARLRAIDVQSDMRGAFELSA